MNYYNEYDKQAAAWLRELIKGGHLPDGHVDERSIEDVKPEDLEGYTQCHFFAGIGGWAYAMRLAGWPDDRPVWTGSPPCQPFSSAGRRGGYDDARHLAPVWLDLVKECLPPVLFGEQVASAATNSKHPWLDDLQDHLEAEDYATGAVVLPACSVGAPHIRQRLWIVAERGGDCIEPGLEGHGGDGDRGAEPGRDQPAACGSVVEAVADGGMADGNFSGRGPRCEGGSPLGHRAASEPDSSDCRMGNAEQLCAGRNARAGAETEGGAELRPERYDAGSPSADGRPGPTDLPWSAADWLYCRDEKWRPVEPGTFPLADGVSARVGRLRGYGNAINPYTAAEVIGAYLCSES